MAITVDAAIEARIQRQVERGAFREPAELLTHALDLAEAEEDRLSSNKEALQSHLAKSFEESERGETYSADEARALLAERRAGRSAQ